MRRTGMMNRIKPISLFLIIILIVSLFSVLSCNTKQEPFFGIYLADTGELVLSQEHIKAYYGAEHAFELNEKGMSKWNSYHTYTDTPKLSQTLYQRDFILKLEGEEICRGKFYSLASSASYSGIAIIDSLFKADNEHNKLWLISDYPSWSLGTEYSNISSELARVFGKLGLSR
jgi:hypothetical protein